MGRAVLDLRDEPNPVRSESLASLSDHVKAVFVR